jgi:hypothetical protein
MLVSSEGAALPLRRLISRLEDTPVPCRQGGTGMNLKMKLKSLLN